MNELQKERDGYELLSDCCGAPPFGLEWREDDGCVTGRCSKCKDGTGFE